MATGVSDPSRELIQGVEEQPVSKPTGYNILVTGVTGHGKSSLVAGISGETYTQGDRIEHSNTDKVTPISCTIGEGTTVTFWDTPGLLSGSRNRKEIFKQMAEKCPHPDFVLHCIKCTDTRLVSSNANPVIQAMRILTKFFKKSFWRHAVIVLTFADCLEKQHPHWGVITDKEKQEAFKEELEEWKKFVMDGLCKNASVPHSVVDTVSVIPVGCPTSPLLLNKENWVENLKNKCSEKLSQSISDQQNTDTKAQNCGYFSCISGQD